MSIATTLSSNSTNVRLLGMLLRGYFALTSRLVPGLARRQAERLFTTPPRFAGRRRGNVDARRETVRAGEHDLAVWQAGPAPAPAVLLAHGWGGCGEQLASFVPPLLARGYRVVWFDQPGHGESGGGQVGLPDFVRALAALEKTHGPFAAAIGHSLGAAALALGLRNGLGFERVALISPPSSMRQHEHDFARWLGLSAPVRDAMRGAIEERYGVRFADLDRIEELAARREPALIVHDADDRQVAFGHAERLAACLPSAHLIRTHGLGHFRILRDAAVVQSVVDFVDGRVETLPGVLPRLPVPAPIY